MTVTRSQFSGDEYAFRDAVTVNAREVGKYAHATATPVGRPAL
jgi:hypothetical protein